MKNIFKKNKFIIKFLKKRQFLTFFLLSIYYLPRTLIVLLRLKFNLINFFKFMKIITLEKDLYFSFYSTTNKLPTHDLIFKIHFLFIGVHQNRGTNFHHRKIFEKLLPPYKKLLFDIENRVINKKLIENYFILIKNFEFEKFISIYLQEFNEDKLWDLDFFDTIYECIIKSNHLEFKKFLDGFFIKNFKFIYEKNHQENIVNFLNKYYYYLDIKNLYKIILKEEDNKYSFIKKIIEININFHNSNFTFLQSKIKSFDKLIQLEDYDSLLNTINSDIEFSLLFKKSLNKYITNNKSNNTKFLEFSALDQKHLKKDLVIYTCLFGDYDIIPPLSNHLFSNIKFVCITDNISMPNNGWELVKPDILISLDSDYLKSRYFKAMPWEYFNDFNHSLYIDCNYLIRNIENLIKIVQSCENFDLGMFLHPECSNTLFELINLLSTDKIEKYRKINILKYFQNYNIKINNSFYEGSFIYRKHNDVNKKIFNKWWDLILNYPSRDQIFLTELIEKNTININRLSDFGNARENIALIRREHMK